MYGRPRSVETATLRPRRRGEVPPQTSSPSSARTARASSNSGRNQRGAAWASRRTTARARSWLCRLGCLSAAGAPTTLVVATCSAPGHAPAHAHHALYVLPAAPRTRLLVRALGGPGGPSGKIPGACALAGGRLLHGSAGDPGGARRPPRLLRRRRGSGVRRLTCGTSGHGADRIFDWFRQACPARRGARRLAKSAVACTWTTPLEDGWRSDERGECRSGQLLNHDDDELAPNPSQAPRGRESGRTGAFTSAEPLSGGPRLSR